jgi:zinc protease
MTLTRLLSVAFIGVATASAAAPKVTTFTLENGLTGVVIEDHRAPVVTNMVWYRVGAADELPGESGVAHFFEHLMFKGTDEIPEGAFSKIVAENGGQDNAFTSRDYTAYFQQIAADRLETVVRMEADRMRDLVLSDAVIVPERDVILEERSQRTDNDPSALFSEQMSATLFMNHPYRIPVIGWRAEVAALTRDEALAFYDRYYAPDNAIMVVAGDVDPAEVRRIAEKHYGPLKPSGRPRAERPQEPPHLGARRLEMRDARVRQPYLMRQYLTPSRVSGDPKDAAALTILAEVLGGSGVTSRLGRALQVDEQLAVGSGAWYSSLSLDPAEFSVYAAPTPGVSLEDLETKVDAVMAALAADGPTDEELRRARAGVAASEIYAQDSGAGLARRYGAALAVGLSVEDVENWPRVLEAVTAEDVKRAAGMLRIEASVTGYLMGAAQTEGTQG